MQTITALEQSYEQLKAMLRIMPPQEVRQKIWRSWKEEKKALEEKGYVKRTRVEPRDTQFIDDVRQCGN
ncbi:hypothetical protein [Marinomonas sp. BSi20584]|uniref:hypothetical protein n=1 Tax=Marinomonas sp. BSi20584 TaxID=1594462 RepID=UPI0012FDCF30|nr:hypothetical protein [Marinomonas sp. BSi20584]